jgi:hypothetical protein
LESTGAVYIIKWNFFVSLQTEHHNRQCVVAGAMQLGVFYFETEAAISRVRSVRIKISEHT